MRIPFLLGRLFLEASIALLATLHHILSSHNLSTHPFIGGQTSKSMAARTTNRFQAVCDVDLSRDTIIVVIIQARGAGATTAPADSVYADPVVHQGTASAT